LGKRTNFIVTAFVVVLALAVLGQVRAGIGVFPTELPDQLYRAAQLFGLEGDWTFGVDPLPWELELARVLAPLVTLASIILVLARGAWLTLSNQRVRLYRNHLVLVGLDELAWHFARACRSAGLKIVAVEGDETNPHVERARRLNIPVISGDPLTATALTRAGIRHAAHVIAFLPTDSANIDLSVSVKTLLEQKERGPAAEPLRVHCHMRDASLAAGLERYPKLFLGRDLVATSFFNVDELAARKLMHDHPTDVYADAMGRDQVHVVIVGATRMAREVLLHIANTAHFATGKRPRVTLCARAAPAVLAEWLADYSGLDQVVELATLEVPSSLQRLGDIAGNPLISAVSEYIVCGDDDAESLANALVLRHGTLLTRGANAPIMLHMRTSDGLARLLESVEPEPEIPDGLYPFGTLDEIVDHDTIINARQDDLARALHENYLDQARARPGFDPNVGSHTPWRSLAESYRRDSRHEADHLEAKLRAASCVESDDESYFAFRDDEIERLARMEKNRFQAVRRVAGWRHALIRSNFGKQIDLTPWDEQADRSYDLASVAAIPEILRQRLGIGVRRECIVGVTGHRLDRVSMDGQALRSRIESVLAEIVAAYPDAAFTVLSPLAEGADRLVASIALEMLPRARLHVPLPLPYEIYVSDFGAHPSLSRAASIAEFQALLGLATRYFEMPLKFGNVIELEPPIEGEQARARQYALAGAYVVQRCHEMIAVWDGNDSEREGGTAQIVQFRREGVPAQYRFADAFFPPVTLSPPRIVAPS